MFRDKEAKPVSDLLERLRFDHYLEGALVIWISYGRLIRPPVCILSFHDEAKNVSYLNYKILLILILSAWVVFEGKVVLYATVGICVDNTHHSFLKVDYLRDGLQILGENIEEYLVWSVTNGRVVSRHILLHDKILIKEEWFLLFELLQNRENIMLADSAWVWKTQWGEEHSFVRLSPSI